MCNKINYSEIAQFLLRNDDFLRENIEAGKIKSVIDKTIPLSQTADVHKHYGEGHPKEKIVITMETNNL